MGTLVLMAACAEQPTYQDPAPTRGSAVNGASYAPSQANPCNRSDFPAGSAGDAEYTNCVIQS
jgi:hypothetical protein